MVTESLAFSVHNLDLIPNYKVFVMTYCNNPPHHPSCPSMLDSQNHLFAALLFQDYSVKQHIYPVQEQNIKQIEI